ncbi:MAG: phenylalanine--tRNA ligase subunit beta [Candidatus Schekmanbacteria bacterium]|nr:phenylalanine--tRNA ligase subunit beta [Candidatus Schekmanbacteria bacterium]
MKISYQWLKEYVDFDLSPEELAQQLTMLGLEVEGMEKHPGDVILEINVTANRGDCLSYIGIAREVALLSAGEIKLPAQSNTAPKSHPDKTGDWQVEIVDSNLCPRYTACLIKGVKIIPSPDWLVERLEKSGIRALNNVVDITNYILLEWGQPLHAFDSALLEGNKIIVRPAFHGEQFITLDGKQYSLDDKMPLICDARKAVALGGIMGGQNTAVNENTRAILLECAYFNPVSIRYTSRKLGINTESSYRFARNVDGAGLLAPVKHALQLFRELAGGTIIEPMIDNYPSPIKTPQIFLRFHRVNQILGTQLTFGEIKNLVGKFYFTIKQETLEGIIVEVPTFRTEIEREIDIIEEIARLYGYKNIPITQAIGKIPEAVSDKTRGLTRKTHDYLTSCGFWEAINFSFTSFDFCSRLKLDSEVLRLTNPLNQGLEVLRHSLLPGLLSNVIYNINRQISDLKLYEIGRCYLPEHNGMAKEVTRLGVILTGKRNVSVWYAGKDDVDFYDLKGILEGLATHFKFTDLGWERSAVPYLHPGQNTGLSLGGEIAGQCGRLHPQIQQELGLAQPVYYAELDLNLIFSRLPKPGKVSSLPRYPAIYRDLALVIDKNVPVAEVQKVIRDNAGEFLKELQLFDVYTGDQAGAGKKSLAFAFVYQSHEGTLSDEQINLSQENIIKALGRDLNAFLR